MQSLNIHFVDHSLWCQTWFFHLSPCQMFQRLWEAYQPQVTPRTCQQLNLWHQDLGKTWELTSNNHWVISSGSKNGSSMSTILMSSKFPLTNIYILDELQNNNNSLEMEHLMIMNEGKLGGKTDTKQKNMEKKVISRRSGSQSPTRQFIKNFP